MKIEKLIWVCIVGLCSIGLAKAQQVEKIRHVAENVLPYPLMTDSLDIHGNSYSYAEALSNYAMVDTMGEKELNADEDYFFYPDIEGDKGMGILDTYRFFVMSPRYQKVEIKVYTESMTSLFQDGALLQVMEKPFSRDSLPAIRQEIFLEVGQNDFSLRTLHLYGDSASTRFKIELLPVEEAKESKDLGLGFATGGKKQLSPLYMNSGTFLSSVSLSPSGKFLLLVGYTITDKEYAYFGRIYDNRGSLIRESSELAYSRWLPTEDKLYFVRQEGDDRRLYTVSADGREENVWVNRIPEGSEPFVVGERVFMYVRQEGDPKDDKVQYHRDPDDRQPQWRDRQVLYEIDPATSTLMQLTFGKDNLHLTDVSEKGEMLFVQNVVDWENFPYYYTHLFLFNPTTGDVDTLAFRDKDLRKALFTEDGQGIFVSGSPNSFNGVGLQKGIGTVGNGYEGEIYLYDLKSRKITPLTKDFDPSVTDIKQDARGVLYFSAEAGSRIKLFSCRKGKIEPLTTTESCITGFSVARNAPCVAYIGQSEANADRLKVIFKGEEQVFWDLDAEKMADFERPVVKDFAFTCADGTPIDAWYYLPPHFDENKKYPMLVYYYGGTSPTQRRMEGRWSLPMFASQGYVVLTLNPSGTTGYGQKFAARHINAWGEPTASEIIACIEAFVSENNFVNPQKIGCFGASYGGFMTQYLVSKTDLFATAISHAGISSISNYWGSGYWGMGYGSVASYGSFPWNRKDIYVEQSPLFRADKIHTPLLLLHGDSDTNVPTAESVNLYNALKVLGREVAFITFTGEDHAIQEHERKLRWTYTMMAWFAKYLQDSPQWWNTMYGTELK